MPGHSALTIELIFRQNSVTDKMLPWGTFPVHRVWSNICQLWLGTSCRRGSRLWKVAVCPADQHYV